MYKVIVIGSPGAGKSVFSRRLAEITHLPLYHLDMIWHNPDRTNISREEFDNKLNEILAKNNWIIDGNYNRTIEMRLKKCDTVFFLDYPVEVCLAGAEERVGKKRDDMPWTEDFFDPVFRQFIIDFPKNDRGNICSLLAKYNNVQKYIFTKREDAERFLENIQ